MEAKRWAVTYTKHLKQRRKVYHDGFLVLSSARLALYDDARNLLDARFLRKDEAVHAGASLALEAHLVDVGDLQPHHPNPASSAASKIIHRVAGSKPQQNPRSFQHLRNESKISAGGKVEAAAGSGAAGNVTSLTDSSLQEWSALYTTQITQKAKKYHDGVVRLAQVGSHAKQIILLDEDGVVLGSRYLKSGESMESGMKCQLPNYLIEICEPRNHQKDVVPKGLSEAVVSFANPKNGENTSNKIDGMIKVPKFSSPLNCHDLHKGKSEHPTSSRRPEIGKPASNKDDPLQTDRHNGRSDWTTSSSWLEIGKSIPSRLEIGKSTSNSLKDPLRTACEILSIMKKPSAEVKFIKSMPAEQTYSAVSFESKIVLEESHSKSTLAGSCIRMETLDAKTPKITHHQKESSVKDHPTSDHKFIMGPAVNDLGLPIRDIPASDMLNAKGQQPYSSSNRHPGNSNDLDPVMNAASISELSEDKSGTADQLCTKNRRDDGKSEWVSFLASRNPTWKNSNIQKFVDDCPTFDLGF